VSKNLGHFAFVVTVHHVTRSEDVPQSSESFASSTGGDRRSKAQIIHPMDNPFSTEDMAAGYALFRPPIHARILERVRPHLSVRVRRALDVGCGAGLSTRALHELAEHCIGIEPAEAMLERSGAVAPGDDFVVGVAEAIPFAKDSIDLISAAGSLNYVKS
jgi:SAM-dependent methyltransferase